jgi:DNA-binding SARP family transcriptional activator
MVETGPGPARPLIERPRLTGVLGARFARRLTVVTGGGGAGKTTILRQCIEAEVDHIDVFHSCTAADREPSRLAVELDDATADVLAIDPPSGDPLDGIAEMVLAQSPRHVCLVVDDTHVLDHYDTLETLLQRLPANGHLLLSGRRRPALDTARLDAGGQLLEIGQADLLMTHSEQIDFANRRGIDIGLLDGAEGWPAFIELAASGSQVRSRRYLEEEALREIAPERRRALAAFALVGGGDDAIVRAMTGVHLLELIEDLPLVRWDGTDARLHDLWAELLIDELDAPTRHAAIRAATEVHREAGRFDRALDLARSIEAWPDVTRTLGVAVRDSVDGGLLAAQLRRWRGALPASLDTDPVVVLIDGLIEREVDPTSERAWDLLDEAARSFEASDDHELTLVALLQLAYISRIRGSNERLAPTRDRLTALAEIHPPARPFLAFGEAWNALTDGRPDVQYAALQSIADADLPPVWQVTRDHLTAHALYSLGRPDEGLGIVPRNIERLAVAIPGALVTESQCLWYSGHPEEAMRQRPADMSERYGARDLFIAAGWNGMMSAWAGDARAAQRALEIAAAQLGESPSTIVSAQTVGIGILIKLARGDEAAAAEDMAAMLDLVPVGPGTFEQLLRGHMAIPYVLAPETREFWDRQDYGPSINDGRAILAVFVAARERGEMAMMVEHHWSEPGVIAANLPHRWAIEFALMGLAVGRPEGGRLAAWLCEHWGEPARSALRGWVDDERLGATAREVLSSTPTPPVHASTLRLLGPTSVLINEFVSDGPDLRRERVRALLSLLALKPDTTRDQLAGTLWPEQTAAKAAKNLRTTLAYAHGVLEPRRTAGDAPWYIRIDGQQVHLHHSLAIDVRRFESLLDEADAAERAGRPNTALPLLVEAIGLWGGDLAEDLDAPWLDLDRIHLRSRFVRAACRGAELLVATDDAQHAAETARRALDVDPWNERSYLALAAAYDAIGDHTSARAVMQRCRTNSTP